MVLDGRTSKMVQPLVLNFAYLTVKTSKAREVTRFLQNLCGIFYSSFMVQIFKCQWLDVTSQIIP